MNQEIEKVKKYIEATLKMHSLENEEKVALTTALKYLSLYEEIMETHKNIVDEKCSADEVHCTCVPALRAELKRLRGKPLKQ